MSYHFHVPIQVILTTLLDLALPSHCFYSAFITRIYTTASTSSVFCIAGSFRSMIQNSTLVLHCWRYWCQRCSFVSNPWWPWSGAAAPKAYSNAGAHRLRLTAMYGSRTTGMLELPQHIHVRHKKSQRILNLLECHARCFGVHGHLIGADPASALLSTQS